MSIFHVYACCRISAMPSTTPHFPPPTPHTYSPHTPSVRVVVESLNVSPHPTSICTYSHERAVEDFTTALAVLRSKRKGRETNLGGRESFRKSSSAGERRDEGEGAGVGDNGMDLDAKREQGTTTTTNNPHDVHPGTSGAADPNTFQDSNDRRDQSTSTDNKQRSTQDGGDRKDSQSTSEGGDGMSEGGSVLGACHYAR